jgi:hypothetical protein
MKNATLPTRTVAKTKRIGCFRNVLVSDDERQRRKIRLSLRPSYDDLHYPVDVADVVANRALVSTSNSIGHRKSKEMAAPNTPATSPKPQRKRTEKRGSTCATESGATPALSLSAPACGCSVSNR